MKRYHLSIISMPVLFFSSYKMKKKSFCLCSAKDKELNFWEIKARISYGVMFMSEKKVYLDPPFRRQRQVSVRQCVNNRGLAFIYTGNRIRLVGWLIWAMEIKT